jgi:capsular polysaccharide transport system permease protein
MSETNLQAPPRVLELKSTASLGDLIDAAQGTVSVREQAVLWLRNHVLFLCIVVFPVALSVLYFGIIAAKQYVSEARYIVRSAANDTAIPALGGDLSQLMSVQGMARATDDTNVVNEYLRSRDMVAQLTENIRLRQILSRPEADFIARFPNFYSRDNEENLFKHFERFVDISLQGDTGIGVLKVTTFRPEDSRDLALAMLQYSEELVNKLNARAREDSIHFAQDVVDKGEQRLARAHQAITAFRNREMLIDPNKQSSAALDLISQFDVDLAQERATLAQLLAIAPNSPQIVSHRTRITALESQIAQQRSSVIGTDKSIGAKLSEYDQLLLEREFAVKSLTSALTSLENARQDSQRQQLYLERIVEPNTPDQSRYPRRWLIIGFVGLMTVSIYVIVIKFRKSILEHHL